MRSLCLLLLMLLCAPAGALDYLFSGVSVVPMDRETVLADRDVLIRDGRISRIAAHGAFDVAGDTIQIDAKGLYLLPGLAEMHAHVPSRGQNDYLQRVLTLYVSAGVTTIRGMLGEPSHLELRAALAAGDVLGPRLYTSGPSFNGRSVSGADEVVARVRAQKAAGYDFLKVHPGLSADEFDALSRTAVLEQIAFAGHTTAAVGLSGVLASGQVTIDHLDGYMEAIVADNADARELTPGFFGVGLALHTDPAKIAAIAQQTASRRVWNVPTLALIDNFARPESSAELAAQAEMRLMPQRDVERWTAARETFLQNSAYSPAVLKHAAQLRLDIVAALHAAGAGLLLGSDAPQVFNVPGFSLHRELDLLHAAGLSHYEALVTGTVNPARFFAAARVGIIAEGHDADLLLLNGNPLEDFAVLREPAGVMLRGRWLPRSELDRLLARYRQH